MNRHTLRNSILLLLAAFIWGIAFVAQSVGMEHMDPLTFNAGRFVLGSLVLLPFVMFRRKQDKKKGIKRAGAAITFKGGIFCGLAICVASLFQQFGIQYTTVGKAGFITALYIIIVPIMGLFLKKRVAPIVLIGAVLAAVGMYLLCVTEGFQIGKGDLLVFACAIVFSVHILVIDHFSPLADGVELSCIQFLTAGVICSIGAIIFETPALSQFIAGILPLAYAGILSCGVAYTLQIIGQKNYDPTIASLLLSLESVFSVLAGWVILNEELSTRELFGCVLVFAAVVLVQLPTERWFSKQHEA